MRTDPAQDAPSQAVAPLGDPVRLARLDQSRLHNLVGATGILATEPHGLDYRRIIAQHWLPDIRVGDWLRWNPTIREKDGSPAIRHYVVLAQRPHPGRAHEGVWQVVLVAPIPDVTIAGMTYRGPATLPPMPDILEELKIFRWESRL